LDIELNRCVLGWEAVGHVLELSPIACALLTQIIAEPLSSAVRLTLEIHSQVATLTRVARVFAPGVLVAFAVVEQFPELSLALADQLA
jgi:hypothetical protein